MWRLTRVGVQYVATDKGRGMWRLTRVGVCGDSEEGRGMWRL